MMSSIIKKFDKARILVIGDLILDKYIYGDVERINPEAPVPILHVKREESILGGSGNVAANIISLGGSCMVVGQIGRDLPGRELRALLDNAGIKSFLIERDDLETITKTRIVARNQQVIRVDREIPKKITPAHVQKIISHIRETKYDLIVISDYAKGVVTAEMIRDIKKLGTKLSVDPKLSNLEFYKDVFLITPNLSESKQMCAEDDMDARGMKLVKNMNSNIVIKRGVEGASLFCMDGTKHYIPSKRREVYDVVGAGDTFISSLALGIASDLDLVTACSVANIAAGVAVEKIGTSTISAGEMLDSISENSNKIKDIDDLAFIVENLKRRGMKVVFTNGCFDILHIGHTKLLREAKEHGDVLVIGLNTDSSIRTLKGIDRPINNQNDRAEVLSHLSCVDYIVLFDDHTPCSTISRLRPNVHVKGGDYRPDDLPEAEIVKEYGGKIEIVKLVDGISTTRCIEKTRAR